MTYNDKNNFININEIKNLYKPKAENLNLEKLKENLINKNKLCGIKNNNLYYDNIYNYLISFEINTTNNKTKWKNVLYPKDIFDEKDNKITKDKKRQNFRIMCSKYKIINNKLYYIKTENNEENKYLIPFEIEKYNLLYNTHENQGHLGYQRLYQEIINKKYYWKGIIEDCKNMVSNCITCIKQRGGKKFTIAKKNTVLLYFAGNKPLPDAYIFFLKMVGGGLFFDKGA